MQPLDWLMLPLMAFFVFLFLMELRHLTRRIGQAKKLDSLRVRAALSRFLRRAIGLAMVLVLLLLLRYPWLESHSPLHALYRLTAALVLVFLLFTVAIWDFRAIRREIGREFQDLSERSVRELRKHMEHAVEKDERGG